MAKPGRLLGQAFAFALFAGVIGYFSASPKYRHAPPGEALVRLAITQPGTIVGECRQLSEAELAKLAANMRAPVQCPRERSPLAVHVELDGAVLFDQMLPPSGLSKDGVSTVYRRFPVAAGVHRLQVKLNDDAAVRGFNFHRSETLVLKPGQIVTIDFNREHGGILLK